MSAQKAYKDTKEKDTSKVINFATSNTDWTSALQPAAGAASSSPDAVGEDLHRPGEGPINELVSNWWLLIFVPLVLLFLILLLFLFLLLLLFLLLCRTNIMFWPFCRSLCFFQLSGAVLVLLGTVLFLCVCVIVCVSCSGISAANRIAQVKEESLQNLKEFDEWPPRESRDESQTNVKEAQSLNINIIWEESCRLMPIINPLLMKLSWNLEATAKPASDLW